jgi:pyruvate ferredoxin oxidoreductase alpha subunit
MDRCESYNGNGGPLSSEVPAALYRYKVYTEAVSFVYGLAGRDFTVATARSVFDELKSIAEDGREAVQYRYVGLRTKDEKAAL